MREKAKEFFAKQTPDTPFFLYLAFTAPHVPINPAPEFRGKSGVGLYGDYVQRLDYCTDVVLDRWKSRSCTNTLVIVTSDDGAMFTPDALKPATAATAIAGPEN